MKQSGFSIARENQRRVKASKAEIDPNILEEFIEGVGDIINQDYIGLRKMAT